jgi:hypothetical protein
VQKVEDNTKKEKEKKGAGRPCPCVDPRPALGPRPGVGDPWSPVCRRPAVGVRSPGCNLAPPATQPCPLVAGSPATRGRRPQVVGLGPAAGRCLDKVGLPLFFFFSFLCCPPFFAQVVNSCWLVLAHARPAQSSPKNFKLP